jgi:olefin beta-lactone synthetase
MPDPERLGAGSRHSANIARYLPEMALRQPSTPALKIPRGRTADGRIDYLRLSFRELSDEVYAWAELFRERGVRTDDRVLVMVKQGLPLIASAFALFHIGAVPIVIDPGMGLRSFLSCVERSRPRVLLGIPLARLIGRLFRNRFRSVEIRVPASASPHARLHRGENAATSAAVERKDRDLAAILFTSGSTGAPKGVCYEHGMFAAQVRLIRETYEIEPGEIDLPMLPIFALFNPALGMTTIVPEIDPRRPAAVDPARIVQAITQEGVTNSFGSPTLWKKIAAHCSDKGTTLPTMRRVLSAGAPVPADLWMQSFSFLTSGQLHSPYGATESLPVSSISAKEVADLRAELGTPLPGACVGRPVQDVRVKIIALKEGPIADIADAAELAAGQVGEIIVQGPVVTKEYDGLAEATLAAKISDGEHVWHRMGDCGFLDQEGRLWFCGRKVERIECGDTVLFTEPCEQVFREVPGVTRCALVGLGPRGRQTPALVVQWVTSLTDREKAVQAAALRERARKHASTAMITRFYFHPDFPVDVRHNAKIHRLTLARWAERAKAFDVS